MEVGEGESLQRQQRVARAVRERRLQKLHCVPAALARLCHLPSRQRQAERRALCRVPHQAARVAEAAQRAERLLHQLGLTLEVLLRRGPPQQAEGPLELRLAALVRPARHQLIDAPPVVHEAAHAAGAGTREAVALREHPLAHRRRLAELDVRVAQLGARGHLAQGAHLHPIARVREHAVGRAAVVEQRGGGVARGADHVQERVQHTKVVCSERRQQAGHPGGGHFRRHQPKRHRLASQSEVGAQRRAGHEVVEALRRWAVGLGMPPPQAPPCKQQLCHHRLLIALCQPWHGCALVLVQ